MIISARARTGALRAGLAVAAVLAQGLSPAPAAATHRCGTEQPYCVDTRTLVQRPGRQEVVSRELGHHCYSDLDAGDPNHDRRVLLSRIGVVFSDVTRRSGYLESVTIYFDGQEPQILGSIDAFARKNDFHVYDAEMHAPGTSLSLRVGKQVEFTDDADDKDVGVYAIRHESAAGRPGGSGPGGHPGGPAPPTLDVDCHGVENLQLAVMPPSQPPCRNRPPEPCLPQ